MQLGQYHVQGVLAHGGLGTVVRAVAPDGRPVAIKVLQSPNRNSWERFDRERLLLAELGLEQGFVPLLDAGFGSRGPFIVMPLLEGGTLRDRLVQGPLDVDDALELVHTLAETMARAHAREIVHRDLKPENVFRIMGHDHSVQSLAFVPDRPEVLISGDSKGGVKMSELEHGAELRALTGGHQRPVVGVCAAPGGRLVVSAGRDGRICLWNAATGKLLDTIALTDDPKGFEDYARPVVFAPDGRSFLAGTARGVVLRFALKD